MMKCSAAAPPWAISPPLSKFIILCSAFDIRHSAGSVPAVLPAVVLLLGLVAQGCKSVEVVRAPDARPTSRLAVIAFDESGCYQALRDYVLFGSTGYERPGVLVARHLGRSLESRGLCKVASQADTRAAAAKLLKAKPVPTDDDWCRLGREVLQADAVLLGEVETYRSAWVLFFHVSNVAFRARCLDTASGKELWRARVGGWRPYAVEEDLLAQRCQDLCYQLIRARP